MTGVPGSGASGSLSLPSIWIGSFRSAAEWHAAAERRDGLLRVADGIDDQVRRSRHPFSLEGYCNVCDDVRSFAMAWHLGAVEADGSVHPAWTLNACCPVCGLVSRMRALLDHLANVAPDAQRVFVAERLTECYDALAARYPAIIGSEWLGDDRRPAEHVAVDGVEVRHEDVTALSFDDDALELVITQDVFEHVPDYPAAFAECARVLEPGGRLVFTVPCFAHLDETDVIAEIDAAGEVVHHGPPEIHGNPVGDGSVCFQHFGWDLLDALRSAGFADAVAHAYWGPWAGHLGGPSFVYEARCATT